MHVLLDTLFCVFVTLAKERLIDFIGTTSTITSTIIDFTLAIKSIRKVMLKNLAEQKRQNKLYQMNS